MFSGEKGVFQARMTFKNSSGAGGWLERKEKNQKENKAQKLVGIHNPWRHPYLAYISKPVIPDHSLSGEISFIIFQVPCLPVHYQVYLQRQCKNADWWFNTLENILSSNENITTFLPK